jgi:hypothetical protein
MKTPRPSSIERLEPRIAPASVTINPAAKTAIWTDWDGDVVTLKWTTSTAPAFATTDRGLGLAVDRIDLSDPAHDNVSLTLTVKTAAGTGDGHVDLGRLNAPGVVLKSLTAPKATFAEIDCGDNIKSFGTISLYAMGAIPADAFPSSLGDGRSDMVGTFTSFKLVGDLGAGWFIMGGGALANGSITIGGSIRGDSLATLGTVQGKLSVVGSKTSSVTVGGSIFGGDAAGDGSLNILGFASKVTVKGSLLGGEGSFTGFLDVFDAGTVTIGGSLIGGSSNWAGAVSLGDVATLAIAGSIHGGTTHQAGYVQAEDLGRVTIGGSVIGGDGGSGIFASSTKSFSMRGSLHGGLDIGAGAISLGVTGTFTMNGGIFGHPSTNLAYQATAGYVHVENATSVSILGGIHAGRTLSGSLMTYNGALFLTGNTGTVTIKGGVHGNNDTKAYILAEGTAVGTGDYFAIKTLNITGDVSHASIATGHTDVIGNAVGIAENPDAGLGKLNVTGNWLHSSLLVGVNDTTNNGANVEDTRTQGDAARLARVDVVKITGRILDDPRASGFSGFEAEKIAKITISGATVFKTGQGTRYLDVSNFVIVREI